MDDAAQTPWKSLGPTRSSRHQALRPTRSVPSRRRIEDDPFRVSARRGRATFSAYCIARKSRANAPLTRPGEFLLQSLDIMRLFFKLKLFRKFFKLFEARICRFRKLFEIEQIFHGTFCPEKVVKRRVCWCNLFFLFYFLGMCFYMRICILLFSNTIN